MKNKINLVELLHNCPSGMELDYALFEDTIFIGVEEGKNYPILIKLKDGSQKRLTKYGCHSNADYAKCVIFPKGKTTWEGFVPPCKFKDGDIIHICDNYDDTTYVAILKQLEKEEIKIYCFYNFEHDYIGTHDFLGNGYNVRLATEEEKEELFNAINDEGYYWNGESKTLEKLIKPKPKPCFKCGDRIRHKSDKTIIKTIGYVYKDSYALYDGRILFFSEQDQYELIPNKFDISSLKPFDKVLVRDFDNAVWEIDFFSRVLGGRYFKCLDLSHVQCIPYEGNEYLYNTNKACSDYFKTWEK